MMHTLYNRVTKKFIWIQVWVVTNYSIVVTPFTTNYSFCGNRFYNFSTMQQKHKIVKKKWSLELDLNQRPEPYK